MDFIGKYHQWYSPYCREYNPQFNPQLPLRTQSPERTRKTTKLIAVIIIIIMISILIGYILFGNYYEPHFEIIEVDLEPFSGDEESRFDYEFSYYNFLAESETIKWVIKLIGNETVYSTHEFNDTISRQGHAKGCCYIPSGS